MESPLRAPDDPGFRLIETCLWTPDTGVHRRHLHMSRMVASAEGLGIDASGVDAALSAVSADGPRRLRLTLDSAGRAEFTLHDFVPVPEDTVWTLALSDERLRANDPWLAVKSTERNLYDETRSNLPAGVDEVLFLNEKGELCEGTITNLFVDMGEGLITPPLCCGVLPGVLRADLLARGKAREGVLRPTDLHNAKAVYVGNALRGLIRAHLPA